MSGLSWQLKQPFCTSQHRHNTWVFREKRVGCKRAFSFWEQSQARNYYWSIIFQQSKFSLLSCSKDVKQSSRIACFGDYFHTVSEAQQLHVSDAHATFTVFKYSCSPCCLNSDNTHTLYMHSCYGQTMKNPKSHSCIGKLYTCIGKLYTDTKQVALVQTTW